MTPTSPIRVVYDLTLPYRVGGGTATFGFGLLAALRARPEVELRLVAASRRRGPVRSPWRRLARSLREALWLQVAPPAAALAAGADLLHAPSFLGPLAAPAPLVVTIFDTLFLTYPEHYPRLWLAYFRLLVAALARRAAAIATISEASKREIVAAYGVAPERVHVTYPGIEPRFGQAVGAVERLAVRARYGLTEPYLLHVGSLVERKNVPRLIEAFAALKAAGRPEVLVLAGIGRPGMPGHAEARAAVARHGLGEAVRWLGFVPDAALPALYAAAEAAVVPSLAEGFGFPVLEAMAAGTPVAASRGSSLGEIAGEAALLFDPLDPGDITAALHHLLTDAGRRDTLAVRGRARAADFTWARTAEATLALYRGVLGRGGGG